MKKVITKEDAQYSQLLNTRYAQRKGLKGHQSAAKSAVLQECLFSAFSLTTFSNSSKINMHCFYKSIFFCKYNLTESYRLDSNFV